MTSTTCPSWCYSEHPNGEPEPIRHYGPHWPPMRGEGSFSADVAAMKDEKGDVGVFLSADHKEFLTPVHARSVARALLAAADWVEDSHNI